MPPWPSSRDAAALSAHPYEIGFDSKELLEQATTRRLSLDRRSAPTDTDVEVEVEVEVEGQGRPAQDEKRHLGPAVQQLWW
ncbi:hypothetical protein DHEL01_v205760 [Diaporthe helianthi]|uniref:Uncharacterized protein n=1 Tax=Diaporthe helianthi TaxID=158607 RepID=A0A2P5I006_DIAHE|nr:hypothetical protein DHEL01_v205760 [Diaporthe helianthi]